MKSLDQLISLKVPLAGARALGIIKCRITSPYQNAFDRVCKNILELVPYTIQLREIIQDFSSNATNLFNHPYFCLPGIEMSKTIYTDSLFESTNDPELDGMTIMALQLILQNMLILFERQYNDYLQEGQFSSPAEEDLKRFATALLPIELASLLWGSQIEK